MLLSSLLMFFFPSKLHFWENQVRAHSSRKVFKKYIVIIRVNCGCVKRILFYASYVVFVRYCEVWLHISLLLCKAYLHEQSISRRATKVRMNPNCDAWRRADLHDVIRRRVAAHGIVWHCTASRCDARHCVALHGIVWRCTASRGVAWRRAKLIVCLNRLLLLYCLLLSYQSEHRSHPLQRS
jgi:hypothetical protein